MKTDFIDINLAASISGKSLQTIRRAIKAKKISARKKKTPQGFNYFISKQSVIDFFQIKNSSLKEIPIENRSDIHDLNPASQLSSQATGHSPTQPSSHPTSQNSSSLSETVSNPAELKELKKMLQSLMTQYQKEREQIGSAITDLQGRLLIAENQVRLLSAPKKKWFQFWK